MGKTSLIHAGLFPLLRQARWHIVYVRPLDTPDERVVRELWQQILQGDPPANVAIVDSLARASRQVGEPKLLVVLDQFEDVTGAPLPDGLHGLQKALVAVQAGRFRNVRLLVSYRADAEAVLGPFFQDISSSERGLPRYYVRPLSRDGARAALEAGFVEAQVGVDERLLDLIAEDLENQTPTAGVYPPYVQMVGGTVSCIACTDNDGILTEELFRESGGCAMIIGQYLLKQLDQFGVRREEARKVLVALARSTGIKGRRSVDELQVETGLCAAALISLLTDLTNRRMVRSLGGGHYEIVHDYLARLVADSMEAKERGLKEVRETLELRARSHAATGVPLQPVDMARTYMIRDQIRPDHGQIRMLLHSCLASQGPAWFWLQRVDDPEWAILLREALAHPMSVVRKEVIRIVARMRVQDAFPDLMKLMKDEDTDVRVEAIKALPQVGGQDALPDLRKLMRDGDREARIEAVKALGQVGGQQVLPELSELVEMATEKGTSGVTEKGTT